jgi:hypothetical protein
MGTISEWMRVLELSAVYFGLALSWEAIKSNSFTEFVESLPGWFLIGVLWAMIMVFEWRVLHGGIAAVSAILFLALLALGLAQRHARRRREPSSVAQ